MDQSELSATQALDEHAQTGDRTARQPPALGTDPRAPGATGDRSSRTWGLALFAAASIACVVGYLQYIHSYGVNVVFWDDWAWTPLLQHGQPTLASLWAQHTENIMFFPSVLSYALIRLTAWNSFAFFWLSALFLLGVLALITRIFWDEIRRTPLVWLPLPFIVLSLAQYQNTLWAFQMAWFVVLLCIVGALFLLERPTASTWHLVAAALVGTVGSYSSLQGLLVWPAGLVILLSPGWSRRARVVWCAIGAVVIVGYFAGFNSTQSQTASLHFVVTHLPSALEGVLLTAGSVIPSTTSSFSAITSPAITITVGALLLVAGLLVIADWLRHRRPGGPRAFCVAMIVTSILFDLLLIPSRLVYDSYAGTASRYDTFMWPLLLGTYAYLVMVRSPRHSRSRAWVRAPQVAVALVGCAAIVVGTNVGIDQGRVTREVRTTAVDVLANWQAAPPAVSAPYLYPPCGSSPSQCAQLKAWEAMVAADHLSIFSDAAQLPRLRAGGVVPGGVAGPLLAVPPPLRARVAASPRSRAAWSVLSTSYPADPTFARVYPSTPQEIGALLSWAVATGRTVTPAMITAWEWSAPVTIALFLAQYVPIYRAWASVLARSPVAGRSG